MLMDFSLPPIAVCDWLREFWYLQDWNQFELEKQQLHGGCTLPSE